MPCRPPGPVGLLTALALACIPELLQTAADLLWRPVLARDLEDIVRDKFVAHREAAEGACGASLDRSIPFKAWDGACIRVCTQGNILSDGAPSTRAASSCGGQTTSPLPLMVFQHLRLVTMDCTASEVPLEGAYEDENSSAEDIRTCFWNWWDWREDMVGAAAAGAGDPCMCTGMSLLATAAEWRRGGTEEGRGDEGSRAGERRYIPADGWVEGRRAPEGRMGWIPRPGYNMDNTLINWCSRSIPVCSGKEGSHLDWRESRV